MPAGLAQLIATGQIAPFIIALTLLELAALAAYRRLSGRGPAVADYLPNILAGDFLLAAWAFAGTHWLCAAASLLGALLAHGTDMWRRFQQVK